MKELVDRNRRLAAQRDALRRRVRAELSPLVRVLVEEFGARKVTLFGSVLTGFEGDTPDLDLLVEGLPRARYGEALGRLFLLAPLPVDLVPAEWGRPEVVARARAEGEVLYAAE